MRATQDEQDDEVVPLHPPFEIVLRGFNRQQVIDHIESLEGRIAMVEADRDSALGQVADLSKLLDHLRREAEEATGRVELLEQSSLSGAGRRVQHLIELTEQETARLRRDAEQEAEALRASAEAEVKAMLRRTSERCARLEEESRQRRDAAEAEATERMRQFQVRSLAALHLLMRSAAQRLGEQVAEAEHQVRVVKDAHGDLTARLRSARRMLDDVTDRLTVTPEPDAATEGRVPSTGATVRKIRSAS